MCAQIQPYQLHYPVADSALVDSPLGIPASETQIALQQDVVKELANKISWVLGSTYRTGYSSMRLPARAYAWRIVKRILEDHGYPLKIKRE